MSIFRNYDSARAAAYDRLVASRNWDDDPDEEEDFDDEDYDDEDFEDIDEDFEDLDEDDDEEE